MKKSILKILGLSILLMVSCTEELIVDEVIDSVESGGALRNLGVTNKLDIANGTSTYAITLEAQDATGGDLLKEVRVNVGFNDIDGKGTDTTALSLFNTISAASFNETTEETTHKLPVATFTVTLNELVGHINSTFSNISSGDDFIIDFEMVLTDDRVFNLGNATTDVTRTGNFSYFNAQFRYTAKVGDPQRLVLSEISTDNANKLGILKSGDIDTVMLTFDRKDAFVVDPTITRISVAGASDDVVGPLVKYPSDDEDKDDEGKYYFLYTAGASEVDTIDFRISDGATVAGFEMKTDTLETAYIIDNKSPEMKVGATSVSTDGNGKFLNVRLELTLEALGKDTVDFEISATSPPDPAFDTQKITKTISQGDQTVVLEFVPQVNGTAIDQQGLTFNIETDPEGGSGAGIRDLIGNEAPQTLQVSIGN
ncbi:MAG: hypothetical protein GDA51_01670 [Ekhidna sp.]|nr:hypothetical protein [Ekhidna sp.]MBC6425184.1 hypothetical protein [Ekhidna sp.]